MHLETHAFPDTAMHLETHAFPDTAYMSGIGEGEGSGRGKGGSGGGGEGVVLEEMQNDWDGRELS
jgi:hypothetical protein